MSFLGRQAHLLAVAMQFLTRLPAPVGRAFSPDDPVRAARWFPLVGLGVGGLCAAVWLGARALWPPPVAAMLAVGAGVLATGALHEDGLADTADGLGGGSTPARRLEIMKDSHVGTFGVLALALSVSGRILTLASTPAAGGAVALLAAHGAARAAAVAAMALTPYAGDPARAKGRVGGSGPTAFETSVALATGAAALLLLGPVRAALAALTISVASAAPVLTARRLIGGHTGDVLGAVEQASELAVLLVAAASG